MTPKSSASTQVLNDIDPEVARCEDMTSDELDRALADAQIDPLPTINAVNEMVADWKRRRKR